MADRGPGRRERLTRLLLRFRPGSVRARATLGASVVVAIALGIASFALVTLLDLNLIQNAEAAAEQQAVSVSQLAAEERLDPLPPPAHGADFIQVVDSTGRVLAASPNLAGRPPVSPYRPMVVGIVRGTWDLSPLHDEHRQQVVRVTTRTPTGLVTVYAGTSLRDADAADTTTTATLLVGVPLLLLTVILVTWWVTGRALRPVEAIRAEVAEISDRDLHRRVPVPRSRDEIARLAATMNATLDRLEASGVRQRQFIADASHELRSPITVLRTQLEVALAHPDPALWQELVSGALEDTARLEDLASDLLLLARMDAAEPASATSVDLADLAAETVAARRADRVPVRIRAATDVTVIGNPLWLARLITNLLDNAQRYAISQVELSLQVEPGTRTAVLEISDDGPGIPPADRERVFERFTRLDDARSRDEGGAGLGLAIAQDIATHLGGGLVVADSDHGARLVARLPLAKD
ncbi:ATP-binding protein [Kitasatospora sp. MAP5-34]|uniref:sensor histidine kinase n=1 Tax=Kitasatospora sp. MAP5-34 TaxID=3035102 RepID=UPI0024765183|nr:ATP-binding protein [Kitasatospora sp. MAP5-34]MDH6574855.1 signal transduction histidine kinase [Kitasatospora sp. MAP5-34]